MKNKTLGVWILATLVLSVFVGLFESIISYSVSEFLYIVAGLGFFVFGGWASYRLINLKDEK